VLALPSQTPGQVEQYGLTRTQTDRELWAVDSSGTLFIGAAAVNRVLTELRRPWSWIAQMYRLPCTRWLENRAYRWIAEHRSRISFWSTIPECDLPGVACN
jgi:predicted DCC family thiol-disulfide oxidoreductase YuxK